MLFLIASIVGSELSNSLSLCTNLSLLVAYNISNCFIFLCYKLCENYELSYDINKAENIGSLISMVVTWIL